MTSYSLYSLLFGIAVFFPMAILVNYLIHYYLNSYIVKLNARLVNILINRNKYILMMYHVILTLVLGCISFIVASYPGVILSTVISFILPFHLLRQMEIKYRDKFVSQLPDIMSSMSAMLKSGTHFNKVLQIVSDQHPAPASHEFKIVLSEYKLGIDLPDALTHMAKKINRQEMDLTVSAMNIAQSTGGNLAETLDILAETLREKIIIEGKIEALTSMGRMQGRVISIIPVLVLISLYYQDPDGISQFFLQPHAWLIAVVIASILALASFMINRISTIRI